MNIMLRSIFTKAKQHRIYSRLPIILENHTKDISDLTAIEHLIKKCKKDKRIKFITLTELADMLIKNEFPIVIKGC